MHQQLAEPKVDLDPRETAEWLEALDQIVEEAGPDRVNFLLDRLTERAREVLRLATLGPIPLPVHYISTVGVFSSPLYEGDEVDETQDLATSGPLSVGYAQSKWIAELMIRTAQARGVPTTVHRINTGGDSRTGAFNRLDHLSMIIKGCVEAGVAPDHLNTHLQAAPIDFVAAAVVEATARPEWSGGTFHLGRRPCRPWR